MFVIKIDKNNPKDILSKISFNRNNHYTRNGDDFIDYYVKPEYCAVIKKRINKTQWCILDNNMFIPGGIGIQPGTKGCYSGETNFLLSYLILSDDASLVSISRDIKMNIILDEIEMTLHCHICCDPNVDEESICDICEQHYCELCSYHFTQHYQFQGSRCCYCSNQMRIPSKQRKRDNKIKIIDENILCA